MVGTTSEGTSYAVGHADKVRQHKMRGSCADRCGKKVVNSSRSMQGSVSVKRSASKAGQMMALLEGRTGYVRAQCQHRHECCEIQ